VKFIAFHLMQAPEWHTDRDVYKNETDLMVYAEELGFDAVWMAEHHFHRYCINPDPMLLATHVAARTKKIRIGTAANVATLIHPLRIAEQAAMLDNLSEGRVDLGLAKGYGPREFRGYGVDQRDAKERQIEAIEIIMGALTTDGFTYAGKHFQVPYAITLRPKQVQKPHLHVSLATAGTPDTLELAAKHGLSFYVPYQGRKQLEKHKQVYIEAARKAGKAEADIQRLVNEIAVMQTSHVSATNEQSYKDAKPGVDWMAECVRSVNKPEDLERWPAELQQLLKGQIERPDRGYEDFDSYWKAFLYGDTARVIERVEHLKEAGFNNIIVGSSFGGIPYDKVRNSMKLFSEKVMSRFK
jgi:alkanesulfonate monooxygenase SsuD/methylene tetrahydromethanopterin reductase-like flavin-dependent oxidoreductase (luciferase family)